MAKKVSGWRVGRGSSLSAVSRGGAGGAIFFGFGGAAAAWAGMATAGAGETPGVESVPTVGGVAAWGMNGLASPDAGGLAGVDGKVEVAVAAGGFAGVCADGLAGIDAGGAGDGVATGAGLAAGVGDVTAAGGVATVCASAPDRRRGSAVSAPANKTPNTTRSVMRQDPTRGETRIMRAPNRLTMHIKVTNSSPQASCGFRTLFFLPITMRTAQKQRPPRGRPLRNGNALGFHSMPGESLLLRDRRKPATPRPHTQSAISAHAEDSDAA